MKILKRRQQTNRRGAALVEAAFILPIMFMVTLGIIEFGRAMMVAQMVTTAAREGARVGIMSGKSNTDVQASVDSMMQGGVNVTTDKYTTTITVTEAAGNPSAANECLNASTGDIVTVVVQIPFENVSYIRPDWLSGSKLTGKCAMRHE